MLHIFEFVDSQQLNWQAGDFGWCLQVQTINNPLVLGAV
jgi:hypothetical protein